MRTRNVEIRREIALMDSDDFAEDWLMKKRKREWKVKFVIVKYSERKI
jgi:hypothetical protein